MAANNNQWSTAGDKLHPTHYRVIIDMTGYEGGTAEQDGGLTPNSNESFSTLATTDLLAERRVRGNLRWGRMVEYLNEHTQCEIFNINITEANGDAVATSLAFTVRYEQDEYNRELDMGSTTAFITGPDLITQKVAKAISNTQNINGVATDVNWTTRARVYLPQHSPPITIETPILVEACADVTFATAEGDITVETVGTSGSGIEETDQTVDN